MAVGCPIKTAMLKKGMALKGRELATGAEGGSEETPAI